MGWHVNRKIQDIVKKNAGNRHRSLVQVMFFTAHNGAHGTEFGVHAVYLAGSLLTPPRCCKWGGKCQTACKPGSVAGRGPRDGHSSGAPVTGRLARPTRASDPKADCGGPGPPRAPIWSCSRRGLPCRTRRRARGALLPHPFTLARRPHGPGGRSALCGTFPGVAPAGRYPAPCFRGARTFLHRAKAAAAIRPSGRFWLRSGGGAVKAFSGAAAAAPAAPNGSGRAQPPWKMESAMRRT